MKAILTGVLILATSLLAQTEDSRAIPDPAETVHFTVELTDGSRLLGLPVNDSLPWKRSGGVLELQ